MAVRTLLAAATARRPLLAILEDLHWADKESLELLTFLLRIPLGYPERQVELQVLLSHREGEPVDSLAPALDCQQVTALQAAVRQVQVEDSINEYLLDIVEATRRCDELQVGVSTRGALALYRAAQAAALHDQCGGNPLFINELLALLREPVRQGDDNLLDAVVAGTAALPSTILLTLRHRLERRSL